MEGNLYLIEIIYAIFYALLIIFIYFNYVAIKNFSESNKIIIENPPPQCSPNPKNLPEISENDLIKCVKTPSSEGKLYYYYNQDNNLSFIVSNQKSKARNYFTICNNYCPSKDFNPKLNKCTAKSGPYQKCINLLEPPPKCTNSSNPVAIDKTNGSFFYVYSFPKNNGNDPC